MSRSPARCRSSTKSRSPEMYRSPARPRSPAGPHSPRKSRSPTKSRSPEMSRSPTRSCSPRKSRSPVMSRSPAMSRRLAMFRSPALSRSPSMRRSPSVPRNPSGLRNPPVLRSQSVRRTPPKPQTPPATHYVPHSIRELNSYGPRIKMYDDYINLFSVTDDSDNDRINFKKDLKQEILPKSTDAYELEYLDDKTTQDPTMAPKKPILHCYNAAETKCKDICNPYRNNPSRSNPLNTKKPVPIKKISFVLPGCKKPLKTERMNWKDFHKLNVIYQFMDDLEANFPSICTTTTIGQSVEGRDLKILKVSNSNASNVAVWIDSGIHAREWIAPAVNTYIANHIARNFDSLPESVTNKDWYFLPIVNPDGYHHSHMIDRMWRKNRALHDGICTGVDLNRNFGLGWGRRGSSDIPRNAFYRGPHPFSEPESCAMRDILKNSGINFKVYITLHCYGQIIIFPYSFTSEMAPDYVRLLGGATAMSKAIFNTNGTTYKVGISKDVMHTASGTSNDFAHGQAGIPFCYLIELRSKQYKFRLPKNQIEETGQEILSSVLALVEYIDALPDQERIEQNIDSLLESDSFLKTNFVDSSDRTKLLVYEKKKYSTPEKIDFSNDNQSSIISLTHFTRESDDPDEETSDNECSDSSENVKAPFLNNKQRHTSTKNESTNTQSAIDSDSDSFVENNHTSGTNTDKKDNGWTPDSFRNGNAPVIKKTYTCDKETNPFKKFNHRVFDIFDDDNEYYRNKTNTSEKETDPYKEEENYQYHFSSIGTGHESILLRDDVMYGPKQETMTFNKVIQHVPDASDIGIKSVPKIDYLSEKQKDGINKDNKYLPDLKFIKSFDQKKICTTEKGTNLNSKMDPSDFYNREKESDPKKTHISKEKPESFRKATHVSVCFDDEKESDVEKTGKSIKPQSFKKAIHISDSFDDEKASDLEKMEKRKKPQSFKNAIHRSHSFHGKNKSNLNKMSASVKETNTSDNSLRFRSDPKGNFVNQNSFPVKEDSYEAWNNFYEQKCNFDTLRSNLLF